jgi:hypothetical protein
VPDGVTAIVQAAATVALNYTATVYIRANANLTDSTAIAAIEAAVIAYFATIDVGGVVGIEGGATGVVPWSEVLIQIAQANPGTVSVGLLLLAGAVSDYVLTSGQVPIAGTPTVIVNFV